MKVIKKKTFINETDESINDFLSKFDESDIVSTHYAVYGQECASDEWTVIFYKEER